MSTTDDKIANLEARLTALERPAPVTGAPAVVEGVTWPVGSLPPLAAGQVRTPRGDKPENGYTVIEFHDYPVEEWCVQWHGGRQRSYTPPSLIADPLSEPWTDSAEAALRAEVARLTAEVDAYRAAHIATMANEGSASAEVARLTAALAAAEATGREREPMQCGECLMRHFPGENTCCPGWRPMDASDRNEGAHVGASEVQRG